MKILVANYGKMINESGGMAKVSCSIVNEFVRRGHEVVLLYADGRDGSFFYEVDERVQCYDMCNFRGKKIKLPLHLKLRREFFRLFNDHLRTQDVTFKFLEEYLYDNLKIVMQNFVPDVIVSHNLAASNIFINKLKTIIPVVTMSHGDPIYYFSDTPKYALECFKTSVVNQVLLESHAQHIKDNMPDVKTITIGNVVPMYKQSACLECEKKQYKIIFVGALIKRIKQPHVIIEAFAKLAKKFPDWIVELWGPEERKSYRMELDARIAKHGLSDRIFIKGATKDVPGVLQQGDIFVFPSAAEGFGLTLAEGLSMGLPGIGYKNCSGVNELIQDGYNGFLVDDGVEPFAQAMGKLMQDRNLRVTMGQHAHESMKKYAPEKIWNQWEKLLKDVAND